MVSSSTCHCEGHDQYQGHWTVSCEFISILSATWSDLVVATILRRNSLAVSQCLFHVADLSPLRATENKDSEWLICVSGKLHGQRFEPWCMLFHLYNRGGDDSYGHNDSVKYSKLNSAEWSFKDRMACSGWGAAWSTRVRSIMSF